MSTQSSRPDTENFFFDTTDNTVWTEDGVGKYIPEDEFPEWCRNWSAAPTGLKGEFELEDGTVVVMDQWVRSTICLPGALKLVETVWKKPAHPFWSEFLQRL